MDLEERVRVIRESFGGRGFWFGFWRMFMELDGLWGYRRGVGGEGRGGWMWIRYRVGK